jgi:hypothetical protein
MNSLGNLPSLAMPMVDSGGRLSPVWLQFFLTLFARTGGAPGILVSDTQAALESGTPPTDLAPVYATIHAVEAMAAQAMAVGPLLQRIADLEARINETGAAPAPAGYAMVRISGINRQIPYY